MPASGAIQYGTLSFIDTLASIPQTIVEYGEDRLYQQFQDILDIHNRILQDMTSQLCENTTIRVTRYGSYTKAKFTKANEYSVPTAQKAAITGDNLGFPLDPYEAAVQWTKKYMEKRTVAEMAVTFNAITDGDIDNVYGAIRNAIFTPTNYNFVDAEVDNYVIPVKAFFNADGMYIPPDAFNNTYNGATHTHYLATSALTASNVQSLVDTVMEHMNTGSALVYINRGNEAAVRALTGFVAYQDSRIIPAQNTVTATQSLAPNNVNNRAIGLLAGAEIWVKPWIPLNYMFCFNPDFAKPLAFRRPENGNGNLAIEAEWEDYPLRAQAVRREFGVAVWRRQNGAVLYIGGASYVAPTLVGL